jgi:hypothetical protein
LSHVDQATVIIRYLSRGVPVERFFTFLQLENHTGEVLANSLLHCLESESINFMNCRGQSYDNASNMAGKYNGMQACLKKVNPQAVYIPCAAHSLNLVGTSAVDCCVGAVSFFGFVQQLYVFFSASTFRWSALASELGAKGLTVKSLSETRWSARADAVRALSAGYKEIRTALSNIASDDGQKGLTRHEADCLEKSMGTLETSFMSDLWSVILSRYNDTSIKLQSATCDVKLAVDLLESLYSFTDNLRNRFDEFEARAMAASDNSEYLSTVERSRRRRIVVDESREHEILLQGRDKFRVGTFLVIINQLCSALKCRIDAYSGVRATFRVIADFRELDDSSIRQCASTLATTYPTDLQEGVFPDEMLQFVEFARLRGCNSPASLAILLHDEKLEDSFPNVFIAVRMFMCLMVTNCTGERSFSKMALIKNKLRSTMTNRRLNALELLSLENDLLQTVSFADIVEQFASAKSRKRL